MWRGALAVIDALGFKGIWKRPEVKDDADAVFAMFETLEKSTHEQVADTTGALKALMARHGLELSVRILFLSDTIVIGAVTKSVANDVERQAAADATAVLTVGAIVSRIQSEALEMRVPLMYRGCISFGNFKLTEKFIVGVAVDEAAASMDSADAALVWCTPSAARIVSASKGMLAADTPAMPRLFLEDRVPLKGGRFYKTWVVSPFRALPPGVANRKAFLKAAGATFGRDVIEHEIKRQNTLAVLRGEDKRIRLSEDLVEMKARRAEREAKKEKC